MRGRREPARVPVRGMLSLLGTVGALVLLLSLRGTPTPPAEAAETAGDDRTAADERSAAVHPDLQQAEALEDPLAGPTTLTGEPVATRWGDVQVQVTVDGLDIIAVEALSMPDADRRSSRLSERVDPILREEAIATDTSAVSVVSGATYTSRAYAESLQSALDQAGI